MYSGTSLRILHSQEASEQVQLGGADVYCLCVAIPATRISSNVLVAPDSDADGLQVLEIAECRSLCGSAIPSDMMVKLPKLERDAFYSQKFSVAGDLP